MSQVQTRSGRIINLPNIPPGSVGERGNHNRRLNQWLIDQAVAEAKYRHDEHSQLLFESEKARNLPPAAVTAINIYLFGEEYPEWQCNNIARYGK